MVELTIRFPQLNRRQLLIALSIFILLAALAAGAMIYWRQHNIPASQLPPSRYKDLSFPVYFPQKLPDGFTLDKNSIDSQPNVLVYKYTYDNGDPLFISIQPLDPQLDINSFKPTREIGTSIGKGYLVEYEDRTTVAIVTPKTLVLLNAPEKIPGVAIEQFAASLRPVK
jgi:hypothetical protein